jgi:acyl transferase domain-containing protein
MSGHHNTFLFTENDGSNCISPTFLRAQLYVFSGYDDEAITRVLSTQIGYIEAQKSRQGFAANYSYTLFCRRSKMEKRTFVVAQSPEELSRGIRTLQLADIHASRKDAPRIALVFCGQGSQWHAMGLELMEVAVFRESIEAASCYVQDQLGCTYSLVDELRRDKETSLINLPQLAQPATTAIQIALVDLLRACKVEPVAVVGHSSGEIGAAYAVGSLSKEDALRVAYERGQSAVALNDTYSGAMTAVSISEEQARPYIRYARNDSVDIACINGPRSVTLSGDEDQIELLESVLKKDGITCHRVRVQTAYHSQHMRLIEKEYRKRIGDIRVQPISSNPGITMYSTVHGHVLAPEELDADYWVRNLMQPVRFLEAVTALSEGSHPDTYIEVGPHRVWEATLRDIISQGGNLGVSHSFHSLLFRGRDAAMTSLTVLGNLWREGYPVNIEEILKDSSGRLPQHLVDLPAYPWNHSQQYWHESQLSLANRFRDHGRQDLLGHPLGNGQPSQSPSWRGFFRIAENPWLEDHVIQQAIVYPAAGMLCMAIEAAANIARQDAPDRSAESYEVSNFEILKPMIIPKTTTGLEFLLDSRLLGGSLYEFSVLSRPADAEEWIVHAQGNFCVHYGNMVSAGPNLRDSCRLWEEHQDLSSTCLEEIPPRHLYERLEIIGLSYGKTFRNIEQLWRDESVAYSVIRIPDTRSRMPQGYEFKHVIHPATLDAVLQAMFALGEYMMLPTSVRSLIVSSQIPREAGSRLRGHVSAERPGPRLAVAQMSMFDFESHHGPVVIIKGLVFKAVQPAADGAGFLPSNRNLCSNIVWKEDADFASPLTDEKCLDLMAHQNPAVEVLDMSNNTGVAERLILRLAKHGTLRFSKYVVCDPTDTIYRSLRSRLSHIPAALDRVQHASSAAEALKDRYFDAIIVGNHKWLNPTGYLSSLKRQGRLLARAQYGTNIRIFEASSRTPLMSAKSAKAWVPGQVVLILPNNEHPASSAFKHAVTPRFAAAGFVVKTMNLSELDTLTGDDLQNPILSLLDVGRPFFFTMQEQEYNEIHRVLSGAKKLLWMTRGGLSTSVVDSWYACVTGLMRTLRAEDARRKLLTVSFDWRETNVETAVDAMLKVFNRAFLSTDSNEVEYTIRGGRIEIPRLVPLKTLSSLVEKGPGRAEKIVHKEIRGPGANDLQLDIPSMGGPDGPLFTECEASPTIPSRGNLHIAVNGTHLAAEDIPTILGEACAPVGGDVYGTVMKISPEASGRAHRFAVGDSVVAMHRGKVGAFVNVPATHVRKMVKGVPLAQHNLTALATAVHGLKELAPGETVLILGAASPPGQGAIMVSRQRKARILVGYSSQVEKKILKPLVRKKDQLLDVTDPTFVDQLKTFAGGDGATFIFIAAPSLADRIFDCVADGKTASFPRCQGRY